MECFEMFEVRDTLLKPIMEEHDIQNATEYIKMLAASYGVPTERIKFPCTWPIKTLAITYALMCAAERRSMMNTDGTTDGADAWELKRKQYASKLESLKAELRAETFTGGAPTRGRVPVNISMQRG